MGLLQQALRTYDAAKDSKAGVYQADMNEPLAPVGHWIIKSQIEITITEDGTFVNASQVVDDDARTIFPVTEKSLSRTSSAKSVAHPLCDKLLYFLPENQVSYEEYKKQLQSWCNSKYSHPHLDAILNYVSGETIKNDLSRCGMIHPGEKSFEKEQKYFVRWIITDGEKNFPCWKNQDLFRLYSEWVISTIESVNTLCMITGECVPPASSHAKGVFPMQANAKIVSSNDESGFTYRGRFTNETEALSIGYLTSQKAHNALKWISANQGENFGGRRFVCWSPEGETSLSHKSVMKRVLKKDKNSGCYDMSNYRTELFKALNAWKTEFDVNDHAVIAVFDAASKGRLAVTYYSETRAWDLIDRMGYWDETCNWERRPFGIQSPELDEIVRFSYGTARNGSLEMDDIVKKDVMLRLAKCRVEQAPIPVDIVRNIVLKCSNLNIINDDEKSGYARRNLLFVGCAVIKKYYNDYFKEEMPMALEVENKDRSYQFGRLMAVLEKIERDTYEKDEKREPEIIRRQQMFVRKPFSVFVSVMEHLKNAYYPRLSVGARVSYERQVEQIVDVLSENEAKIDTNLTEKYLLGYYLQKQSMYRSSNEETNCKDTKEE